MAKFWALIGRPSSSSPSMHLAQILSSTSTEYPAQVATVVGGTPELSNVETGRMAEIVGTQRNQQALRVGAEDCLAGAAPDAEDGEGGEVVSAAFSDEQASVACGPEGVEVVKRYGPDGTQRHQIRRGVGIA